MVFRVLKSKTVLSTLLALYIIALFLLAMTPALGRIPAIERNDKLLHWGEFFLMGLLVTLTVRAYGWPGIWLVSFGICVVLAVLSEAVQLGIPGRSASPWDFLADVAGILAAIALLVALGLEVDSRTPRVPGGVGTPGTATTRHK